MPGDRRCSPPGGVQPSGVARPKLKATRGLSPRRGAMATKRPPAPTLFQARPVTTRFAPDPDRVANAKRILVRLLSALDAPDDVRRAVVAVEAAQRAWTGAGLAWTVWSIARVLSWAEDPDELGAWLLAVDNRLAEVSRVQLSVALTEWRAAIADRRRGPRVGGSKRTAGRIVWDLMRRAEMTTGTEETIDREVRKALRTLKRAPK